MQIVQEALAVAAKGRTSISIAHRLASIKVSLPQIHQLQYSRCLTVHQKDTVSSPIQDVDRIYFIEGGGVVESGTHEELIEMGGRYASYVEAQSLTN